MSKPSDDVVIDIKGKGGFPSGALSNFAAHSFVLDGVPIASMEGFLQSLKFADPAEQAEICGLAGAEAQGRGRRKEWSSGLLWWRATPYDRLADAYQGLLDRAFDALFAQAGKFRSALRATGSAQLVHRMGRADPCDTILTEAEFCSRLHRLRRRFLAAPEA